MIRPDYRDFIIHDQGIMHYGIKRRSGRYPWGSGQRHYQSIRSSIENFLNFMFPKKEVLDKKVVNYGSDQYIDRDGSYEKLSELKRKRINKPDLEYDCFIVNHTDDNKEYLEGGHSHNCIYCSVAMAMRSKGYDVVARSSDYGVSSEDLETFLNDTFPGAEVYDLKETLSHDEKMELLDPESTNSEQIAEEAINDFIKKQPDDGYGLIELIWGDLSSAHSLFYKKENGTMMIYDGQVNKKSDISEYIDKNKVYLYSFKFIPLQDYEPSDNIGHFVVSKK